MNYRCKKCGHKWLGRLKRDPVQCPRCKRPDWNNQVISGAKYVDAARKGDTR